MVEFTALEVTAKTIWWQGGDMPLMVAMVRWRMARAERGISASFHPLCRLWLGKGVDGKAEAGWGTRHAELQPLARYRRIRVQD